MLMPVHRQGWASCLWAWGAEAKVAVMVMLVQVVPARAPGQRSKMA